MVHDASRWRGVQWHVAGKWTVRNGTVGPACVVLRVETGGARWRVDEENWRSGAERKWEIFRERKKTSNNNYNLFFLFACLVSPIFNLIRFSNQRSSKTPRSPSGWPSITSLPFFFFFPAFPPIKGVTSMLLGLIELPPRANTNKLIIYYIVRWWLTFLELVYGY